jgi:hydroxyacylglutathione hydrolase
VPSKALQVVKVGPLGPFDNNGYLIVDPAGWESMIVDAPPEGERILEAARGTHVSRIIVTHRHGDHWAAIDVLRSATNAPVYCHEADREPHRDKVDGVLADGEEIALGSSRLRVIHTPGHTPGSICLLTGHVLIAGDTLFPGGPGHSDRPEDLQQEIRCIVERLLILPDETEVYPGHGDGTTIGRAKQEYAVFASREHPEDLCGDVLWEA